MRIDMRLGMDMVWPQVKTSQIALVFFCICMDGWMSLYENENGNRNKNRNRNRNGNGHMHSFNENGYGNRNGHGYGHGMDQKGLLL